MNKVVKEPKQQQERQSKLFYIAATIVLVPSSRRGSLLSVRLPALVKEWKKKGVHCLPRYHRSLLMCHERCNKILTMTPLGDGVRTFNSGGSDPGCREGRGSPSYRERTGPKQGFRGRPLSRPLYHHRGHSIFRSCNTIFTCFCFFAIPHIMQRTWVASAWVLQ